MKAKTREQQIDQMSKIWKKSNKNYLKALKVISSMAAEMQEKDRINNIPLKPYPHLSRSKADVDKGRFDDWTSSENPVWGHTPW